MKTHALAFVTMVLVLCACGSKSEDDAGDGTQAASATANNGSRAGANDAVAAVLQSEGTPVARVVFVLETRPVVGQPFSIKLEITAAEPVAALQLSAESATLILAPTSATVALTGAEVPVTH